METKEYIWPTLTKMLRIHSRPQNFRTKALFVIVVFMMDDQILQVD